MKNGDDSTLHNDRRCDVLVTGIVLTHLTYRRNSAETNSDCYRSE